ncbi:MAG TPA: MobQ family relaxase [Steroidobacteraceae bacterium]|nr:MobQ family relaxase [Steroidobacteraceae bacterium]
MAIYRLEIKAVTRGTGRTATSAAAYRAGERIRDERTGALYDHRKRTDVLHKEIFLPSRLEGSTAETAWARDRSTLWNTAEKAEHRSDSRVAREFQVSLPRELSAEQRVALARTFSREVADRYNVAVDLAIHAPRPQGDPRNHHAHLLATTREVTPEGLGPKTGLDRKGEIRSELGLPTSRQEFTNVRARWAELANAALREANVAARVDHRSLEAQGIDREPTPRLPWAAIAAERRGERSEVAERIRAQYRQRVAARRERAARRDMQGVAERSADSAPSEPRPRQEPALARQPAVPQEPALSQDMDSRRRQAVQDWLKHRSSLENTPSGQGSGISSPLSMDEIRQRAVEQWRSLQARGAESQRPNAGRRDRDGGRDRAEAERTRDTPGLGEE